MPFKKKCLWASAPKGIVLTSLWQPGCRGLSAVDPWLCVVTFRWLCPFVFINCHKYIANKVHCQEKYRIFKEKTLYYFCSTQDISTKKINLMRNVRGGYFQKKAFNHNMQSLLQKHSSALGIIAAFAFFAII